MDYLKSSSLEEVCNVLKKKNNSKILAGGTDLLVHHRHKKVIVDLIIDIKGIDILKGIKIEDNYLKIGACTTLNDVADHPIITEDFKIIREAALSIACYQVRNRATIGGNICNASPAADMLPPLYCMDAILTYYYDNNMTDVDITKFFIGPGKTILPNDAILCQVKIPINYKNSTGKYLRHSRRNALDLAAVSISVVKNKDKYTLAVGAVAPTVIRIPQAEEILNIEGLSSSSITRASEAVAIASIPISDLRASKEYRKEMVNIYTIKALRSLMEEQN